MRFEVLHDPAQLPPLESAWRELRSGLPSPTDRLGWTLSYLETMGRGDRLFVVCAFSGDRLEAVAPLARRRAMMCGYEQIGVRMLGEPADLLVRHDRATTDLARELARRRIPVMLPRVPSESATIPRLLEAYGPRRVVFRREGRRCPAIALDSANGDAQSVLSKRMRSDLRRAMRRAEQMGEVRFEIRSPSTREEFEYAFDEAQRVEAASWKGRERTAIAIDRREHAFLSAYGPRVASDGSLRIAFMRINDVAVAMQLAIVDHERYWLIKIGYDESFAKCSPGQLLLLRSLEYAAEAGLSSIEFLGSDAPWTRRWTKHERAMTEIGIYPQTPQGLSTFAGDVGPRAARALGARGAALVSTARTKIGETVARIPGAGS